MITFNRTDFPVPEGPRMADVSPRGTSKVMSSRTTWLPNCLETPWMEMTGSATLSIAAASFLTVPVANFILPFSSGS